MPARLRRAYGTGYLHFITFSCYQRRPLLGAPQCRDLFLRILEEHEAATESSSSDM